MPSRSTASAISVSWLEIVGWVERREYRTAEPPMGFASLNPSYAGRESSDGAKDTRADRKQAYESPRPRSGGCRDRAQWRHGRDRGNEDQPHAHGLQHD